AVRLVYERGVLVGGGFGQHFGGGCNQFFDRMHRVLARFLGQKLALRPNRRLVCGGRRVLVARGALGVSLGVSARAFDVLQRLPHAGQRAP
ncbi:hypothetical protein, partial [Salmonella enterica]|uniref:hypothetical protein n=1 Tax=Salmonella enterica TaxID=28901 RepID=UPI0020C253A8